MNLLNNNKIKTVLLLLVASLYSCRCHTDYEVQDSDVDNIINATAKMSQGMEEYLVINLKILKSDSFFVKNITVFPSRVNDDFFPKFLNFNMYSYYFIKEGNTKKGPYWKDYYAESFDQLPTVNRYTNNGDIYVKYSAVYTSDKTIDFEDFSAEIEVLLINNNGEPSTLKRHVDFHGERECRFSAH